MTEKSRKINWVNVILFFSLALNFFIAGYLVSDISLFRNFHTNKIHHKRPEIRIVDYFPLEEKRKFRRSMLAQREKLRLVQREIIESQKEIFKVISEKDVDEVKLRQAFSKYQDTNDHLQTAINEMVVGMVLKMDYETRRHIMERGKKAHERRKLMREKFEERRGLPPASPD